MTIRIPESNFADKILHLLGKERAFFVPDHSRSVFSPYAHVKAQRESFWKSLLRNRGETLPEGWTYLSDLNAPRQK